MRDWPGERALQPHLARWHWDDPLYCDTRAIGSIGGFFTGYWRAKNIGVQGWFNEVSVATLLYDLFDTDDDTDVFGTDNDSIGFWPDLRYVGRTAARYPGLHDDSFICGRIAAHAESRRTGAA